MIVINKEPDWLSFVGNPVKMDVTGTRMYASTGKKCIYQMMFNDATPVLYTDYFELTFGTTVIRFTFAPLAMVNDSGSQYQTISSINPTWVSGLADLIANNYYISRFFDVVVNDYYITLTAKNIGSEYNLSGITSGVDMLFYTIQSGTDNQIQTGFQIVCQVIDHNTGAIVAEDAITPDSSGKAVFDVAEYLASKVDELRSANFPLFTFPAWESMVIEYEDTFDYVFHLRCAEKFNGIVRKLYNATTYTFRALAGGLSKAKLNELLLAAKSPVDYLEEKMMFLTFSPSTKVTGTNTPERLYFFNWGGTSGTVKAKKYYANNTDATVTIGTISSGKNCWEIICSANTFTLGEFQLMKYDVWIEDGDGDLISEVKTFVVDTKYYTYEYYFLFLNSLGGYDTLRTTGRMKYKSEIERTTFENDDDETSTLQALMEHVYNCNTGSITADMAGCLNDFMLSKEVYWLFQNVAYPIVITSKKKTELADTDRRFNIEFEFSLAAKDKFHSLPEAGNGTNINLPDTGEIGFSG